ncbi:Centromere protein C [Senna tora]|uniref:Centromere protein C n=1 Tax=Senna tora TaxID=362788 RepID=A0A834XDR2_9FABA|nr:Centromere protein C [Senna tora]
MEKRVDSSTGFRFTKTATYILGNGPMNRLIVVEFILDREDMSDMFEPLLSFQAYEENLQEAVASIPRDDPDLDLVPAHQSNPAPVEANAMDECTSKSDGGDAEQNLQLKHYVAYEISLSQAWHHDLAC